MAKSTTPTPKSGEPIAAAHTLADALQASEARSAANAEQDQAAAAASGAQTFPAPDPLPEATAAADAPLPQIGTVSADSGQPPLVQADEALTDAFARRRSPPLTGPRAMPLDPVTPYGHTTTAAVAGEVDPIFGRESTVDLLTKHPNAGVRQRALEAQVAIHHGASDIGIKVRAALDTAREAERTR